ADCAQCLKEYSTSSVLIFSRTRPFLMVLVMERTPFLTAGAYQLVTSIRLIVASAPVLRHSSFPSNLSASKVPAGTVIFSHATYWPDSVHIADAPVFRTVPV